MNKPQKMLLAEALEHLDKIMVNINLNEFCDQIEHLTKAKTIIKCLKELDGQLD